MTEPTRPARLGRRRWPLVLAAAGTGTALVAGGLVVWDQASRDDHGSLPGDCAEILPADVADRLPGTDAFELRGGRSEADEDGVLQLVHCEAAGAVSGDPVDFSLQAVLYDPEEREEVSRMQAMLAEGQLERESDDFELEYSDPPMQAVEWRSLTVGDGGYATVSELVPQTTGADEGSDAELWSSLEYSVANVRVSLFHQAQGPVAPLDSLEALEGVAEDLLLKPPE